MTTDINKIIQNYKVKIINVHNNSNKSEINNIVNKIYVINLLENEIRRNYILVLMKKLNIAFVKSSVYQDLWVTDITNNYIDIFKTTLMRCPAIGLAEHFSADFIIVKDTNEPPCNINKNVLPTSCVHNMQYSKKLKNPSLPFLDETYHEDFSMHPLLLPLLFHGK